MFKNEKKQNFGLFFSGCVFFAKKTRFFRKKQACFFRVATLGRMWLPPYVPIVFEESQLLFLSCGTGRSPRCWRPQLGDGTHCSLLFILATFLMFFKDCGLLALFFAAAVLLSPRNLFLGVFLIPGIRFWVVVFILQS